MPEEKDIDYNKRGITVRWHYIVTAAITLLAAAIGPHFMFNWGTTSSEASNAIIKKLDRQEYQLQQQKEQIQQLREREDSCERLVDRLIKQLGEVAPDTTRRVRPGG